MPLIADVLGTMRFGDLRRLEAALAAICLIYGLGIFIWPSLALDSKATVDLYWAGYGHIIGIPFLLKALFSGWGVIANIKAWPYSQRLRQCGALVGSFIWWAMIWKFVEFGSPFSFGSICALVFLISSIGILATASANLPKPGE